MFTDEDVYLEIPIYMNRMQAPPAFSGEVSLLQYPLRPSNRPYGDQGNLVSVEISTDIPARMRQTYALNTNSVFFDDQADFHCDQMTLISRSACLDGSGLAVGVLHEGCLTLLPISSVSQFRPSLANVVDSPASETSSVGYTLTNKQLHFIEVADNLKNAQGLSQNWKSTDFYEDDSLETEDLFRKNFVVSDLADSLERKRQLQLYETPKNYLSALAGIETSDHSSTGTSLSRMTIHKQVETLLRGKVCVNFFTDIVPSLPPNTKQHTPEKEIVAALEDVAFLIQGYWVVRSSLTDHRRCLWPTRDLLLVSLRAGKELKASAFVSFSGGIPESELEELFKPLCVFEPSRSTWRFKYAEDSSFLRVYPDVASRQQLVMEGMLLELRNERSGRAGTSISQSDDVTVRTVSDLISKAVCNLEEIKKTVQARNPDKLVSDDLVRSIVVDTLHAIEIRPNLFILNKFDNPLYNYRNVLVQIYQQRNSATKAEILQEMSRISGQCILTDYELRKLIKEFASLEKGHWVFVDKS